MLTSCYLTMQTIMKTMTESEEQDVWSATIHRYSTNGLQMPGSDVALGNSKRKKPSSLFSGSLFSRDGTENKYTGRTQDYDMNCMKNCSQ